MLGLSKPRTSSAFPLKEILIQLKSLDWAKLQHPPYSHDFLENFMQLVDNIN